MASRTPEPPGLRISGMESDRYLSHTSTSPDSRGVDVLGDVESKVPLYTYGIGYH